MLDKTTVSILHKTIRDKKLLDEDGISILKDSAERIRLSLGKPTDLSEIEADCRQIIYIRNKIKSQKQDTELYSLKIEIDDLFHAINKYKLVTISATKDIESWKKIDINSQIDIAEIAYRLEQDLQILLNDIKNR